MDPRSYAPGAKDQGAPKWFDAPSVSKATAVRTPRSSSSWRTRIRRSYGPEHLSSNHAGWFVSTKPGHRTRTNRGTTMERACALRVVSINSDSRGAELLPGDPR